MLFHTDYVIVSVLCVADRTDTTGPIFHPDFKSAISFFLSLELKIILEISVLLNFLNSEF